MPASRVFHRIVFASSETPSGANCPIVERTSVQDLRKAAKLVETAAYAEAGHQPSAVVSQLIMLAADLERLAQTIDLSQNDD